MVSAAFSFPLGGQTIGETAGEVVAVADMHQRKAEMARQADAFIALPGELISNRRNIHLTKLYCPRQL